MSIRITSRVWEHSRSAGSTLLTALAIADFADDDGEAYPSIAKLAEKARIDERTVQRALLELVRLGELQVEIGAGPNRRNAYRIDPGNLSPRQDATPANTTSTNKGNRHKKKEERVRVRERVTFDASQGVFTNIETLVERWQAAYPKLAIGLEVEKAACWLITNPGKKDFGRFLNGWMQRASRDGTARPATRAGRNAAFADQLFSAGGTHHVVDVEAVEVR